MSYLDLPIEEIHNAIIKGQVTPRELVEDALRRAKEDNNNCFEYICEKEALYAVEHLDVSKKDNLLWGIPYCLKDNISTKGIPTCASSNILKNYIPPFSATIFEKLSSEGAILIGKNTMDELAMGGSGTTGHLGKTFNPCDPTHKRLVGGSSCGSVACVSANIVPFSVGTDTGDSVRKPASYAGIIGFKPTWGRISRYGVFAFANSLDHVGIFAKNIHDVQIVMKVISGHDINDLTSSKLDVPDYLAPSNSKSFKIAVIKEFVDSCFDETKRLFEKHINDLKEKGYEITYISFSKELSRMIYPTYMVISCSEASSNYACLDGIRYSTRNKNLSYKEAVYKNRSECFSNNIKGRFLIGSYSLDSKNINNMYLKASKIRALIVDQYKKIFDTFDAIYVPSASSIAPFFDSKADRNSDTYLISDNHLAIQNLGGFPSITIPIGYIDGMPFGANLTMNLFKEHEILKLCEEILK